jgi:hypothetical protein
MPTSSRSRISDCAVDPASAVPAHPFPTTRKISQETNPIVDGRQTHACPSSIQTSTIASNVVTFHQPVQVRNAG